MPTSWVALGQSPAYECVCVGGKSIPHPSENWRGNERGVLAEKDVAPGCLGGGGLEEGPPSREPLPSGTAISSAATSHWCQASSAGQ